MATWLSSSLELAMEVLLEIGQSKEVLRVAEDTLEATVKCRLPGTSSETGPFLLPYDCDAPRTKGTFILQKWSPSWECFVNYKDKLTDGERLKVVECDSEVSHTDSRGQKRRGSVQGCIGSLLHPYFESPCHPAPYSLVATMIRGVALYVHLFEWANQWVIIVPHHTLLFG